MPDKLEKRMRSASSQRHVDEDEENVRIRKRLNPSYHSDNDVSLQEVRKLLRREKVRTYNRKEFVPVPSIKKFWTAKYKLQTFLEGLDCSVSKFSVHAILTTSLRMFTALVLIEWESNERFRETFQEMFPNEASPVWTDESLTGANPFRSDKLGLSEDEADSSESAMDLVSVPVLDMTMTKKSKPFHEHATLPITSKTEIGKGAHGKVYRIEIAENCLIRESVSGGSAILNNVCHKAEDSYALKQLNDASENHKELDILRKFRNISRNSKHILTHYGIVEVGNEASVIFPLAAGNLQKLLEGELESFQWMAGHAGQFTDIVGNSCNLADAVDFLHRDMRDHSDLFCRHGDLKPNNFLIFTKEEKMFTGEWKISDMGLAGIKTVADDESGVKKTTKTTTRDGCGPYAAPEMSGPEGTLIGRETDVWSLAAIIMELIIWGFGGPSAWTTFVSQREESSQGLFHENGALSRAVDKELSSWPEVYCGTMSKLLCEDERRASQFLKDLVEALRAAFEIDPDKRANSNEFLNSLNKAYKHLDSPALMKQGKAKSYSLEIRPGPLIPAWEALQRKFDEHRKPEIFGSEFKPNEQIRVSNEVENDIHKWIEQPAPSALCILTGTRNEWLHVSAITHEVYYTARCMNYDVIEFLTLDRYDRITAPFQASLDLVHCFIFQLLKKKSKDQLREYDLSKLAVEDATLSDKVKFVSAVDVLGQIIKVQQKDRKSKPIIVIIDDFWRVCPRSALDATRQQWETLFALLGCTTGRMKDKTNAGPAPNFRLLIRADGWYDDLENLGFSGHLCTPSGKHNNVILRMMLKASFKNDK